MPKGKEENNCKVEMLHGVWVESVTRETRAREVNSDEENCYALLEWNLGVKVLLFQEIWDLKWCNVIS